LDDFFASSSISTSADIYKLSLLVYKLSLIMEHSLENSIENLNLDIADLEALLAHA